MAYATIGDIINRFKPIKSMIGTNSTDVASEEVASVYIADAESFIDGYLAVKYVVPITPISPIITQLCSDLSIFNMFAEKSATVPEWMDKRYERCIETLEMLRDGKMVLNSASIVGSQGDNFAWSNNQDFHPIFSPVLGELDQVPDQDYIDSELADRAGDLGIDENCP